MTNLTTHPNKFAALKAKAEQSTIDVWKPDPGETLFGEIKGSRMAQGAFGNQRQMLLETETRELIAVWLNDFLTKSLHNQGAEAGDLVAITYHGRRESKRGAKYHAYDLIVSKGPAE